MLPSKAAALRAKKRESHFRATIDPAPFAGVIYVLLITMMTTGPNYHEGSGVDLVRGHHSRPEIGARREDAMKLSVARDGKIYFGTTQAEPDTLPTKIRAAVAASSERKIYLQADARARNSDVSIALDAVRAAGITNVAIMQDQLRSPHR